MTPGKVFYAVLNMGLGHAARSLPIIKEFIARGWQVLVGSNGRSLEFLRIELPGIALIETPGYEIEYSRSGWLLPKLLIQFPGIIQKIHQEHVFCEQVVADFAPDLIFSDHCYGFYHARIPSYFLSHQIYFAMPNGLERLSALFSRFNLLYHRKYKKVVIPDIENQGQGLLSGRLSLMQDEAENYFYAGILSSIEKYDPQKSINLLVSISGPEPQRSIFEGKVLAEIDNIPGQKVVVLGKSENQEVLIERPGLQVYSHVPRMEMSKLYNSASLVVSRPGYSTIMELAEIGKKALFVPTPGQTEQIYLSKHVRQHGWFYSVDQDRLELPRDIKIAARYHGISKPGATRQAISNIFENLLYLG